MPSYTRTATDALTSAGVATRLAANLRATSDSLTFAEHAAIPTRNTHHRTRDHFGTDLDTNVLLNGAVGGTASGSTVHAALAAIQPGTTTINLILDGGGAVISTGIKGDLELPFNGVITQATLLADQSGSIVVNLWKQTYASYPPTVTQKITASAPPTITTALKSQDATLTGWTTAFSAGDILRVNVDSATTITRVTLSLTVHRT